MDGYAVARALRQIEALAHVPIVAVTSYAMPGDEQLALAAGWWGLREVLSRPVVETLRKAAE